MDRDYVLRWAHLGVARNPRYRHVIEEQRRIADEHIKEIWAEQEALNAAQPLSVALFCHWLPLRRRTAEACAWLNFGWNTGGVLLGQFIQETGEYPLGHAPDGTERAAGFLDFELRVEPAGTPGNSAGDEQIAVRCFEQEGIPEHR